MNIKYLFVRETKIDKLARKKKELILKRDKLQRDMRNRNSKRETKITLLENAGQTDYENTQKRIVELNRQIDKAVREVDSEQIYVNEVANGEKREYVISQREAMKKKLMKEKGTDE